MGQSDMASGVKVDEVVKLKYDDIKKKKSYRYLVFYIKDEKVIQVEKVGDRNADYQEFLQDLYVGGPDDCRYGVFDFEYTHQCQGTTEAWKKEKLYLSSFDALKKCLVGVQKYIQGTDESE